MGKNDTFEDQLAHMRPRLHRYCARMAGSVIDGEDLVQEVLTRAVTARSAGKRIDNLEGWLLRVAHNASIDLLRQRARANLVPLDEEEMQSSVEPMPQSEVAAISFRRLLELPALQRCAVVLKDVLGHSIEEIADIADCSPIAAKSALQRGRTRLREIALRDEGDALLPLLAGNERRRLRAYVDAFRTGEFDVIRRMLSNDVSVDLVNRLQLTGRAAIGSYFTRYAEAKQWRYALGAVDGQPAMLVYDSGHPSHRPAHFVVIDWCNDTIIGIRDFLYAAYAMEGADWVLLE